MKKLVNKFFGIIDSKNCRGHYGEGYSFTPYPHQISGWDVLCSFVTRVIDACTMLVIILLALKMSGMAKQSWAIVFLPILLYFIWTILKGRVNIWIKKTNKRIRDESYEEWYRNYKLKTPEENEKEEMEFYEEDEFEDDEEELYELK